MKLLWLCNMAPSPIQQKLGGGKKGGLWMDHVLTDLRSRENMEICVLCPGDPAAPGRVDDKLSWQTFHRGSSQGVVPGQEELFTRVLKEYQPDVIHIWGTEYGHSLSMMEAVRKLDLLDRTAISIQGLCSVYARHYMEGIPLKAMKSATLRDLLRRDSMAQQQESFQKRGENEIAALGLARHVIGRTHWDCACAREITPEAQYHFCNETLREDFYGDVWQYSDCSRHRIFASSRVYPIKGFHYLLEALALVRRDYPDAVLAVPGKDPKAADFRSRLRQDGYARYLQKLTEDLHLEGCVQYLGKLSGEEMKQQYLRANVFALPSTIENSPNSLGEAMLLGVPSVAADVGGVTTMLKPDEEGYVYQSTAPYMLAHYIKKVFALEEKAAGLGSAARAHALKTHDPRQNMETLLEIYSLLAGKEGTA